MVSSVDHIELVVRNVDEFVQMFEKLGFKLISRTPHHGGSAELQLPGPNQPIFEIHKAMGEENPEMNHIAFRVDDLEKECKELAAKGVVIERGPQLVKVSGRTTADLRDPDGSRLQLVDAKRIEPEGED
ncbi:VOC family protein [Chloroflexota bacterium]